MWNQVRRKRFEKNKKKIRISFGSFRQGKPAIIK